MALFGPGAGSKPSDPEVFQGSGLQILDIQYNATPKAWILVVATAPPGDGEAVVFFLPRVPFSPASFPCSPSGGSELASSTCCLKEFFADYHVSSAFPNPVAANDCSVKDPPALQIPATVEGELMHGSRVVLLWEAAEMLLVRLVLSVADLAASASQAVEPGPGLPSVISTFVGVARFRRAGSSRLLDSSFAQAFVRFAQSDYLTLSSVSDVRQTFYTYLHVDALEVRDAAEGASQYLSVTFVLEDGVLPSSDASLVPADSVLVCVGESMEKANCTSPCQAPPPAAFQDRLSQPCAQPAPPMCSVSGAR